jgi:hypothetical protein
MGKLSTSKSTPIADMRFETPTNQTSYRAKDAADEWKRTVNFLATTLKK